MFLNKRSLVNQVERQRRVGVRLRDWTGRGVKEVELMLYDILGSIRPRCCWGDHSSSVSVSGGLAGC